jgi:hypothetical protein
MHSSILTVSSCKDQSLNELLGIWKAIITLINASQTFMLLKQWWKLDLYNMIQRPHRVKSSIEFARGSKVFELSQQPMTQYFRKTFWNLIFFF